MEIVKQAVWWVAAGFFLAVGALGGLTLVMVLSDWFDVRINRKGKGR